MNKHPERTDLAYFWVVVMTLAVIGAVGLAVAFASQVHWGSSGNSELCPPAENHPDALLGRQAYPAAPCDERPACTLLTTG